MYLPDEAKGDILKFFSTPAWQAVLIAWRARQPKTPSFVSEVHTIACEYAFREGFQRAIEELAVLPHESAAANPLVNLNESEKEKRLLDPRD